jgi:hypothetical protein
MKRPRLSRTDVRRNEFIDRIIQAGGRATVEMLEDALAVLTRDADLYKDSGVEPRDDD